MNFVLAPPLSMIALDNHLWLPSRCCSDNRDSRPDARRRDETRASRHDPRPRSSDVDRPSSSTAPRRTEDSREVERLRQELDDLRARVDSRCCHRASAHLVVPNEDEPEVPVFTAFTSFHPNSSSSDEEHFPVKPPDRRRAAINLPKEHHIPRYAT
jgi:hypothetical protein